VRTPRGCRGLRGGGAGERDETYCHTLAHTQRSEFRLPLSEVIRSGHNPHSAFRVSMMRPHSKSNMIDSKECQAVCQQSPSAHLGSTVLNGKKEVTFLP